jgi:hypothetical protein
MDSHGAAVSARWAPWWVYVAVIAPANLGKEALLPGDLSWWVRTGLTAAVLVTGIAVVTAVSRSLRGGTQHSSESERC